ncbi:MAG: hypothetical protein AAGG51_02115 [Cyanobacteria bacterium P01_G01_bin.54]
MARLLLYLTIACITLLSIVLSWHPAQAAPDTITYAWGFQDLGQSLRVCKQITAHPLQRQIQGDRQPVRVSTRIVDGRYCQ